MRSEDGEITEGKTAYFRGSVKLLGRMVQGMTLISVLALPGSGDIQTVTQSLTASLSAAGRLSVPSRLILGNSTTNFAPLTGDLLLSYWARTSSGGGGSISVQATSDFTPGGGPTVGAVSYSCTSATLGTACSQPQAVQTSSQTAVVTLPGGICTGGGGLCSSQEPNTVVLHFELPNYPRYQTGVHSAQLMFTISTL